jgi:ornithine carbamoyltransferase
MNLISLMDWDNDTVEECLQLAHRLKERTRAGRLEPTLRDRTLALVFEKASMRTRVSFEVAMTQLGGNTVYLSRDDINLGEREPIKDGARVLSRYVDVVAARVYSHDTVVELGEYADVPIINALSDAAHPCQALADAMTIQEHLPSPSDGRVAFIGDANNVAWSLAVVCARLGWQFVLACPEGYGFDPADLKQVQQVARKTGGSVQTCHSPEQAAENALALYTDVWVSMGQEEETKQRRADFAEYTIDDDLLALADPRAIVLHCLPAHRGEEITDSAIESPQSAVFDQAENRLHAARALLRMLVG